MCYKMSVQWYSFRAHLVSEDLAAKFVQFSEDDETKEFLEKSREKSDQLFTQLFHSIVKFILSWAMNKTSINGYYTRDVIFFLQNSIIIVKNRLFFIDRIYASPSLSNATIMR